MPTDTFCFFCEEPLNSKEGGNYNAVKGWEQVRSSGQGGGHGLTERTIITNPREIERASTQAETSIGLSACRDCMDKRKRGINVNQTGMF